MRIAIPFLCLALGAGGGAWSVAHFSPPTPEKAALLGLTVLAMRRQADLAEKYRKVQEQAGERLVQAYNERTG